MDEPILLRIARARLRSPHDVPAWVAPRLISQPDAAISKGLREQTRRILATLLPREEQVLRMRFGIGEPGSSTMEETSRRVALPRERILWIESRALRKLRSPGRTIPLRTARRA